MKFICSLIILFFLAISCNKNSQEYIGGSSLRFSVDTLKFDTLLNGIISPVFTMNVYNETSEDIFIDEIILNAGTPSIFTINVNGKEGSIFNNVLIPAKDSIRIFALANPKNTNLEDIDEIIHAIQFHWKDKVEQIILQAFVEDVITLDNHTILSSESFIENKRYLIKGNLTIDENATLTIPKNTTVYAFTSAAIIVNGKIHVNGAPEEPVSFLPYRKNYESSGSWRGIQVQSNGKEQNFQYAIIKDAINGIHFSKSQLGNDRLNIEGTKIYQSLNHGLYLQNIHLNMNNSLLYNNPINIYISGAGAYQLHQITTATYSTLSKLHPFESIVITDKEQVAGNLEINFTNSILWGDLRNEIRFELSSAENEIKFENSIYKVEELHDWVIYLNSINSDPLFQEIDISKNIYNFKLEAGSPAIDFGKFIIQDKDITGALRVDGYPDAGCYEYFEN